MAKQTGIVLLEGKLGGIVFYTTKYGNLARTMAPVSKEKLAKDPKYAGRRDANSEFGYASRMGKLLRTGVRQKMPRVEIGSTHHRLSSAILKAVKKDDEHLRGNRQLTVNNARLLQGFNWKDRDGVNTLIRAAYAVQLDLTTNSASLSIGSLMPKTDFAANEGATHIEISLVLVAVDYEGNKQVVSGDSTGKIDLNSDAAMSVSLACALPSFSGKVLIAGIGVQGWQELQGVFYHLADGNGFEISAAGVNV